MKKNISILSERLDDLESNKNTGQRVIFVLSESMGETISSQDIDETYKLPGKKPNGKS